MRYEITNLGDMWTSSVTISSEPMSSFSAVLLAALAMTQFASLEQAGVEDW
jgi:hypothetical protein